MKTFYFMQDFRNMVSFCEHLNTNINVWFDEPGLPLVAEPHLSGHHHSNVAIKATLIMATLGEEVPVTVVNMPQQQLQPQPLPRQVMQQDAHHQAAVTPPERREAFGATVIPQREGQRTVASNRPPLQQHGYEGDGFEADDREDGPEGEGGDAHHQEDDPDPEQLPA